MTNTVIAILFLSAVFLMPMTVLAEPDDIEREGIEKCTRLASKMFNNSLAVKHKSEKLGKPSHVTHIESFLVWRASCAEKRPTDRGNVNALCQGDAVAENGQKRKVFYWEILSGKSLRTGYYWCEQL